MTSPQFIHLRLHSEYSVTDGIVRLDRAVDKARADGMPALALTDLANLFGMVKFYQRARSSGIKPIIGCDVWISNQDDRDKPFRLLLLCQSKTGYLLLSDLLTRAYRCNQYRGRAEIDKSWFGEFGTRDLIAISGAHYGDVGRALLNNQFVAAQNLAKQWNQLFPGRFYIELQRMPGNHIEAYVKSAVRLASTLSLPVVATHPIQFLEPDEFKAHEARVCIAEGYVLADQRRPKRFNVDQYFKSQQEMAELFADIPSALANSIEIAKRCNVNLELGKSRLPQFPTPNNMGLDEYLRAQAIVGFEERIAALYPDEALRAKELARYKERLDFEIDMIIKMGFPGYFLIVADFINWAKQNGVPVGPGRGSGAGSLVAFSLGITDLDPLRYDLLFERFLNPERVSMPDFDVDFCQDGRDNVIDYVKHKYGADSVSQIATFGTMAAKAVVRDVGRVLDLPYNFVDQLAKLIPFELGMTLKKAREQEPLLNERAQKEEEVHELLELAERLEGITRNVGMHAGGVLIAPGKLTDFCPLYCAGPEEPAVSQFDKDDVEQIGLVKFDFLGLRTLTILDWAVRYIKMRPGNDVSDAASQVFSLEQIPLDDAKTYALLKACNTTAVFQLESRGMKDLVRRLQPDCFDDVVALVALFRPGPLQSGMVDDFIARKHGRAKFDYMHPQLETILKPTYGVIVYQEQVMQIAQILGGYSLGSADLLRRAMGKKKPEEMAKHRNIFIAGAVERGVDKDQTVHLFNLMEKFAEYGFNKSHSAAYALVAYQTAYLKAHYPAEFMASTLSADMDDTDKVRNFYEDSVANGLQVLAPDIHESQYRFMPVGDKQIRYGLGAIKGTGEAAINHIIATRERGGLFIDLFDFCRRVDKRIVNRRVVESLIRAGAFDSINANRASLLASLSVAMDSAEQESKAANQNSLFNLFGETTTQSLKLVDVPAWNDKERLLNEKQALGFYFSGHPFNAYVRDLQHFIRLRLSKLVPSQSVLVAGIISSVRIQQTRRGRMAVLILDDATARIEVSVFNELFEQHRAWLKEDQLMIVEGKANHDEFSGGIRVSCDRIYDLVGARSRFAKGVRLICNGQSNSRRLMEILGPYRQGSCPVSILYKNNTASCELELGADWKVNLHDNLLQSLASWLNEENVQILYS